MTNNAAESAPHLADIKQIRRANMLELIGREASKAAFARKVGTDPAYISQLLSEKTRAEIGDAFARNVEKAYELPHGWMDNVHASTANTFAERVRAERIRARLSQGQLAKLAGLSQTTISDIERGRNEGSRDLLTLANALNVSAEWLVTGLDQADSGTSSPRVAITEHAELLEAWGYLLPAEKQSIMEQIRQKAAHNKAVLEQLRKLSPLAS